LLSYCIRRNVASNSEQISIAMTVVVAESLITVTNSAE